MDSRLRVSTIVAALGLVSLPVPTARAGESLDPAQFSIGACGSVMSGYDGKSYPCEPDRKAVCEYATKRCVCLERVDCGGTRDEPF